jgi:hypothetical protein
LGGANAIWVIYIAPLNDQIFMSPEQKIMGRSLCSDETCVYERDAIELD